MTLLLKTTLKNSFLRITKSILTILILTVVLSACSSDEPNPAPGGVTPDAPDDVTNTGTFTAKVDGIDFIADQVDGFGSIGNSSTIIAQTIDNRSIDITIFSIAAGTYTATGDPNTQVIMTYNPDTESQNQESFYASSGSITITSNTSVNSVIKRITGTFSFGCEQLGSVATRDVTVGNFDFEILHF